MTAGGTASFVSADETPAVPHSSPKRARETEGEETGGDQPLTLALLQQALQVNQQQITNSLHESLEGLGRRVGNLEQNMDQHVENTTRLLGAMTDRHCDIENTVKKELEIDIDMADSFVPGLRRGFAIVPIAPRAGEDQSTFRSRIRDSLRHIREAKVITGQKPQGGDRHFWAAISETPERRKRAQFAGKIKRLVLESEGDKHKLDVEFGTGNVWYNSVKIASATTAPPAGADTVGIGWISLPTLARQIGVALGSLTETWEELKKPLA
eukprot:s4906_g2.t2